MSSGLNTTIYGVGTNTSRGVGTGDPASMNTSGGILDRACGGGGNIRLSMCHAMSQILRGDCSPTDRATATLPMGPLSLKSSFQVDSRVWDGFNLRHDSTEYIAEDRELVGVLSCIHSFELNGYDHNVPNRRWTGSQVIKSVVRQYPM